MTDKPAKAGQGYNFRGERAKKLARLLAAQKRLNTINEFCDLISGGDDEKKAMPVADAAAHMGLSITTANIILQEIKKGLGDQAE